MTHIETLQCQNKEIETYLRSGDMVSQVKLFNYYTSLSNETSKEAFVLALLARVLVHESKNRINK